MAVQDYLTDVQSSTAPAKQEAAAASEKYAQVAGDSATLSFKLKEALNKKLGYNKDLIEQQNVAMKGYFTAPSEAREKYQGVFNPFEKEKLVSQHTGQALEQYSNVSDLLTQRMGQVSDIVGEGTAGYQGVVTSAKALADAAQTKYQNAFSEYQQAAGMQQQADQRAIQERQMIQSKELAMLPYEKMTAYQRAQIAKSGVSGTKRLDNETKTKIRRDVAAGKGPNDLFAMYGKEASLNEIMEIYNPSDINVGSPHGTAHESDAKLRYMYENLGGYEKEDVTGGITEQISGLASASERNKARVTNELLKLTNTARQRAQGIGTGPLSALIGKGAAIAGRPQEISNLEADLGELLRTVRKESTGVAFSPQEIADLEIEIPKVWMQEGTIDQKLTRIQQRMISKLGNYGITNIDVGATYANNDDDNYVNEATNYVNNYNYE